MAAERPGSEVIHRCPECGGHDVVPVRLDDMGESQHHPRATPPAYPGMMECQDCGALIEWGL